jgi:hypothetical protein
VVSLDVLVDDKELLSVASLQQRQRLVTRSIVSTSHVVPWLNASTLVSTGSRKFIDTDGTGGWALSATGLSPGDSHANRNGKVFLATLELHTPDSSSPSKAFWFCGLAGGFGRHCVVQLSLSV